MSYIAKPRVSHPSLKKNRLGLKKQCKLKGKKQRRNNNLDIFKRRSENIP